MSAPTPGPWVASSTDVLQDWSDRAFRRVVARASDDTYRGVIEAEQIANARLISAAPELLSIVIEVLPIMESLDVSAEDDDEPMEIVTRCRAAIAKATGGDR